MVLGRVAVGLTSRRERSLTEIECVSVVADGWAVMGSVPRLLGR